MRLPPAFIAVVLTTYFGTAQRAIAQGVVKSAHNGWQVRCDMPPGALHAQCALMQTVMAEDRPSVGLTVMVLKTADQKSRIMRVVAPWACCFPPGSD
jgi:invasion protein IalB